MIKSPLTPAATIANVEQFLSQQYDERHVQIVDTVEPMTTPEKIDRLLTAYARSGGVVFLRWARVICGFLAAYFAYEPVKSIVLLLLAILLQLMVIEWQMGRGRNG